MIYVTLEVFLKNSKQYINEASKGFNVYICLDDGTELKLERFVRQ